MNAVLPAPEPTTDTVTLPVRCRPDQNNWGQIVFFVGLFVIFCVMLCTAGSDPKSTSGASPMDFWLLLGGLSALFLGLPLMLGVWLMRATIIADESGLRWRRMGAWQSVPWEEITDYYEKILSGKQAKTGPLSIVECGTKRIKFSTGLWKSSDVIRLKHVVTKHAVNARPTEWAVLGTRPDLDFPRVFRYDTKDNQAQSLIFGVLPVLLIVMLIASHSSGHASLGWQWDLASWAMVIFGLLPMFLMGGLVFSLWRATRQHFSDRIEISRDGLHFTSPKRQLKVSWHEMTDYYIAPRKTWEFAAHYCVVTTRGSFDFIPSISEVRVLTKIIHQQSLLGPEKKWAYQYDEDALGGQEAKWSSGCEGVGERVYHYRTRANRAMLWMPTAISLAILLPVFLDYEGLIPLRGSAQQAIVMSLIFGLLTLWGWYRYFTASVQMSGAGITQYAPFRKKHIAWGQVEKFYKSGDDIYVFGNVVGPRVNIRFWLGISDVKELKEEIARRAINATGTWKEQESQAYPQAKVEHQ